LERDECAVFDAKKIIVEERQRAAGKREID